jgi:hypothetical protein
LRAFPLLILLIGVRALDQNQDCREIAPHHSDGTTAEALLGGER